jgi:DNA-binding HxlR family transcriptional regulator
VFPQVPPKVEYELTELGQSLAPVLLSMRDWGERLKESESAN